MEQKILNIVKFNVTDRVGNSLTEWEQAAVFYEDGRVELVSVSEALQKASQSNTEVLETTTDLLEENYDKYCSVANFDATKKKNSIPFEEKKDKKSFFGNIISAGVGFIGGFFVNTADWLTVNVLRKFKKKQKKKKLKDKAIDVVNAQKKKTEEFVKQSVADREQARTSKVHKAKTKKKVDKKLWKDKAINVFRAKKDKAENSIKKSIGDRKNFNTDKVSKVKAEKKGKRGIFKRLAAVTTALSLTLGIGGCDRTNSTREAAKEQTQLTQDELTKLSDDELLQMINSGNISLAQVKEMLKSGEIKNDVLDSLSYEQLLNVTNSVVQQQEMNRVGKYLDYFNGTFAGKYLEANHPGVRAALTWEEVNVINLAYNEFSKEEIQAIFNGHEIKSADFTNSYKEATLQLMGAFVLETRDMPVNLDSLLNTDEGKAFYQKYNELFLKCKETTGQEQINAVNAFYQGLNKDFPITEEVREVGISHSQSRDDIEAYKLSITPIVAAAEMMFQNLDIDHTLSDKAIAYFNDLGLCEFAQGEYERAEQIMLCSEDDKSLPTYEQFMNAKVKELTSKNIYFVSDEKRDISQYDLFQKWVNGHFNLNENGNFVIGGSISQSITTKVVDTYSKSSTTYRTETSRTETDDRNKAVSMAGEDAVSKAENEVNKKLEAENEAAKSQGEAEAEKNRQEMQEEADKEADKIRDEIEKDEQDLQDKIEDANNQIDKNHEDEDTSNDTPVNEDDLGHGVDFDDEHSNDNGDLDNSVEDITTNGSGTGADLPDPNESGSKFEEGQPDYNNQPEGTFTPGEVNGQTFIEYEEEVSESVNYTSNQTLTTEQIADAIVEEMVNNPTASEEVFVYTK